MLTFRSLLKASASLILMTGGLTAPALAQETPANTTAATDDGEQGEEIVVNGTYARSLAAGIAGGSSGNVAGGSAGGAAGASRLSRLICLTIMKMMKARMAKLMATVMKLP